MIAHATGCLCAICRQAIPGAVPIEQVDRDTFAAEWARWISGSDGEAKKLTAGENGAVGSPRWVALQAIARTRMAGTVIDG